jgi:hypothetical protein
MITTESIIFLRNHHKLAFISRTEIKKGAINEATISASIIFLQIVTMILPDLLKLADHSTL